MPKSTSNPAPAIRNGSLRFKSASERDTAFRMLKAARVRFPGVLQKAVDNRTGVYLILFPGASQLVTAAHWENAMDTAGIRSNPQFTRPSLIGSVVDTYFPVDLMEGSVKGAVEDLKDLVGRSGGKGRGQKRK